MIAWLEGQRAIGSSAADARRHLEVITFVEREPGKLLRIWRALETMVPLQAEKEVELMPLTPQEIEQFKAEATEEDRKRREAEDVAAEDKLTSDIPTRLTVELDGDVYRFGAMTETASAPQRDILLTLIWSMRRMQSWRPSGRREAGELGEFLEKLLFPADLQQLLSSNAPLVLTCDATVARVHWEMVAQPDLRAAAGTASKQIARFWASIVDSPASYGQPLPPSRTAPATKPRAARADYRRSSRRQSVARRAGGGDAGA